VIEQRQQDGSVLVAVGCDALSLDRAQQRLFEPARIEAGPALGGVGRVGRVAAVGGGVPVARIGAGRGTQMIT
jgi:hypothetical protein